MFIYLVMKEMNSLTHSCTHSLASLATLPEWGTTFFITWEMLFKGKKLLVVVSTDAGVML